MYKNAVIRVQHVHKVSPTLFFYHTQPYIPRFIRFIHLDIGKQVNSAII